MGTSKEKIGIRWLSRWDPIPIFANIVTISLLAITCLVTTVSRSWADSQVEDTVTAARQHQRTLEVRKQKFLHDHSDPSGKVRPDLERKGLEHTRQMPVKVYMPKSTSTPPVHKK